jgi:hypothetical protein
LTTLADAIPPVVVTTSHKLTDGATYTFQASKDRQRAALLEVKGNIYVAFASFCELFANVSRGWVLGWNASKLSPLTANRLNDDLAPSASNNFFLSSVWMSGGGLAAADSGLIDPRCGCTHLRMQLAGVRYPSRRYKPKESGAHKPRHSERRRYRRLVARQ